MEPGRDPYLQVSPVDLVDDVQVTRQQVFEEVHRPAFQGFRQDGVVGVGAGPNHDVPGLESLAFRLPIQLEANICSQYQYLLPAELLQVHQDPHQLGDGQRRVGVVQLDGHLQVAQSHYKWTDWRRSEAQKKHGARKWHKQRDISLPVYFLTEG